MSKQEVTIKKKDKYGFNPANTEYKEAANTEYNPLDETSLNQTVIENHPSKEIKLINVFEANEKFEVFRPYNPEEALKYLENFDFEEYFENKFKTEKKESEKIPFNYTTLQDKCSVNISELYISSGIKKRNNLDNEIQNESEDGEIEGDEEQFILDLVRIVDLMKFKNSNIGATLEYFNSEKSKKQFIIKLPVEKQEMIKLISNFMEKKDFKSSEFQYKKLIKDDYAFKEIQFLFEPKNIRSVILNDADPSNTTFVIKLDNPPIVRTTFESGKGDKKFDFKDTIFPFRDFSNELNNLKFKNFFFEMSLANNNTANLIFDDIKLNNPKVSHFNNIIISNEREQDFKELCDLFIPFVSFLQNPENGLLLVYQLLNIVSENILSYYSCIEFLEDFMNKEKGFFSEVESFDPQTLFRSFEQIINYNQGNGEDMNIYEFQKLLSDVYKAKLKNKDQTVNVSEKSIQILNVRVTGTLTLYLPLKYDKGNHLLRNFLRIDEGSRICRDAIRISFQNDVEKSRWDNALLVEFMKFYLNRGISIIVSEKHEDFNRNWEYFGYSNSQFREQSSWAIVNRERILKECGNFTKLKTAPKFGARVGLLLTSTEETIKIPKECVKRIDDIERCTFNFTDGVGRISFDYAVEISSILGILDKNNFVDEEVPSAFQARFMGCKGVWVVNRDKSLKNEIAIRPSQEKFLMLEGQDNFAFNVKDYSKFNKGYLNRQVILLLSSLGVPNQTFLDILRKYENALVDDGDKIIISLIHNEFARETAQAMVDREIKLQNDSFFRSLIKINREIIFKELQDKARIFIDNSVTVMGIADDIFGELEENEAFMSLRSSSINLTLGKEALVTKCPCLHPGDIRKLKFRNYNINDPNTEKFKKYEEYYKNVIVFSIKGNRNTADKIAGSDLDGDMYFIYYDESLTNPVVKETEPMDYKDSGTVAKVEEKSVTFIDVIDYIGDYISNNNLGLISDAHVAHADEYGAGHINATRLATKFVTAVDAPKTGKRVELSEDENPKEFPHFMKNKKNIRPSKSVLGSLYDKTENIKAKLLGNNYEGRINQQSINSKFGCSNIDPFILEAVWYYSKYYAKIRKILNTYKYKNESEVISGFATDENDKPEKNRNYSAIDKVRKELAEIATEFKDYFHNNSFFNKKASCFRNRSHNRASAYYYVSYNLGELLNEFDKKLSTYKEKLRNELLDNGNIWNNTYYNNDYLYANLGLNLLSQESFEENLVSTYDFQSSFIAQIDELVAKLETEALNFLNTNRKLFERLNNQEDSTSLKASNNKVLSFPWISCSNILVSIRYQLKCLKTNKVSRDN